MNSRARAGGTVVVPVVLGAAAREAWSWPGVLTKFASMETAIVILDGDCQTVRLPKSVHLPTNVIVRQDGESVVLEPAKPTTWSKGFFESIHVTDPAFERPEQGQLPPVRNL